MSLRFHKIEIIGSLDPLPDSVILIANHFSWWDGFWVIRLNHYKIFKKFHFFILKETLEKYKMFNYIGGFSVEKKSKSALESIEYAIELLENPKNLVMIFPQGEIQSQYERNIQFERGIERIIAKGKSSTHIVFVVNLIDYFSESKPSLYIYSMVFQSEDKSHKNIERAYNDFHVQCLEIQKKKRS
jgi:1-acyl-sn-glycerol-3-phosphate acyltransferase